MRPLLAAAALGFALAGPAFADDPVKPEIGPGPHLDSSGRTSGAGEDRGSSTGPSQPADADREEDERKASEAKEKAKKKPGYQEEAPAPRASHTSLHANN